MTNMPLNQLEAALPHRRMEAWKWTDVRGAISDRQSGLSHACSLKVDLPDGLTLRRASGTPPSDLSAMSKLAAQFGDDIYVIDVPAGFRSTQMVVLSGLSSGHARILFNLGKGAELRVRETHNSAKACFINLDMQFELSQSAKLVRTILHHDHADTTRIATTRINAWKDAEITQHSLSFGAGLSRLETRVASLGTGLKAEIHGAYLLNNKRHCDMTSYLDLGTEHAYIRQAVKGVLSDKSRGVFQGKFHVRRPAQHTDAEMRHDAIMLSDNAHVRAKPELEIYADDVACTHGNTVGALDETALFYMRQRGIPLAQARALLTEAFVAQAFTDMADSAFFMRQITTWLEQNS